ncbi:glycerophosphodiester phosphodiesterase [Phaeacidiphilus oryzae]|uniref:glycerophosphodiester phosphodiesterase n=1 Tax=Phaeacidiphilus oryzae TaxID=348818 RepID=UPI00126A5E05|nr:glycerophosphodiester phosphodiesterase [Phaeacidiphilus oryzae]
MAIPNRDRVHVVAHRGSSGSIAEHTLAAYRRALEEGADALECDVRLTSDGHLVCLHDRRIDRTSNGRGVVSTLSLAELLRHDFGSWMSGGDGPSPVLTLEDLLGLVADCGRRVELAIETKHPTRYGPRVEERLIQTLRRYGLLEPPAEHKEPAVRVMSFSRLALLRTQRLAPGLPTVFLTERPQLPGEGSRLPGSTRIAGPGIALVRAHPAYVARAHRAGYRVHVWTVDDPADVELCLRLGVDALITNHPARILAQLGRTPPFPSISANTVKK